MSIRSCLQHVIIAGSNLLYLIVKRLLSPYKYLFSWVPGCFLFPLHFTFSNRDCAHQIVPFIVPIYA